jgi:hypothetical protein
MPPKSSPTKTASHTALKYIQKAFLHADSAAPPYGAGT